METLAGNHAVGDSLLAQSLFRRYLLVYGIRFEMVLAFLTLYLAHIHFFLGAYCGYPSKSQILHGSLMAVAFLRVNLTQDLR